MKTPREILLEQHQAAAAKLNAVRSVVVAGLAQPPATETFSWRELARSLRWHFAALSAAWMVVLLLNMDRSPSAAEMGSHDQTPPPQQVWASLRENRRLLLEYSDIQMVETTAQPGRRSEIQPEWIEV